MLQNDRWAKQARDQKLAEDAKIQEEAEREAKIAALIQKNRNRKRKAPPDAANLEQAASTENPHSPRKLNKGELARARKAAKKSKAKAAAKLSAADSTRVVDRDSPAPEGVTVSDEKKILQSARDDLEWARLSGDEAAIKTAKKVLIGVRKTLGLPINLKKKKPAATD